MNMYRVLMVDDEQISREYIRQFALWSEGRFVLTAEAQNAQEALDILSREKIDIVILDVFMPDKNGVALSAEIAEKYHNISMLAVSSYDDYDYVREILKNGAYDYILKHRLDDAELRKAMESIIERRKTMAHTSNDNENIRQAVKKWLFDSRTCPFSQGKDRLSVSVIRAAYINDRSPLVKDTVIQGIINILETVGSHEHITVLYREPDYFILCALHLSVVSESEIQARRYSHYLECRNNIHSVYGLHLEMLNCPLFSNYNMFPSYIGHLLHGDDPDIKKEKRKIALTISRRKALLAALDEQDEETLKRQMGIIYQETSGQAELLLATRELLDIIINAAKEYGVQLEFLAERKDLYEWMRSKNKSQLADRLMGLYEQVMLQTVKSDSRHSKTIEAAMEYLQQNYSKQIGLQETAEYVRVNRSYLSRRFHSETGVTIVDYLNHIRVNASKKDIRNGIPLKEAAVRCGFMNYNYFFKVFKEYEGTTPGEIAKKAQR